MYGLERWQEARNKDRFISGVYDGKYCTYFSFHLNLSSMCVMRGSDLITLVRESLRHSSIGINQYIGKWVKMLLCGCSEIEVS